MLCSLLAYLIGSIPTAVWVGKKFYRIDIREHGSKNAGATNTFRILGKKPGKVVLLIDVLKGILVIQIPAIFIHFHFFVAPNSLPQLEICAALSAVFGHVFPIFAQFRGGKGVATSLGVVVGMLPVAALICILIFLSVFLLFQYVSLGAIIASLAFPLIVKFIIGETSLWYQGFSVLLSLMVIWAHRKNISRLLQGQENKMNLFKK